MTTPRTAIQKHRVERFHKVMQGGNLSVADLSRWFDRPNATVRGWVKRGLMPGGGPLDKEHAEALLKLLEKLVRFKKGFPLKRCSPQLRMLHLRKIREACLRA